jgi:hypothetical protein
MYDIQLFKTDSVSKHSIVILSQVEHIGWFLIPIASKVKCKSNL